ncbi:MAG: hypothetical protein R6U52_08290 [Kosmotogaceae bacterium]
MASRNYIVGQPKNIETGINLRGKNYPALAAQVCTELKEKAEHLHDELM